MHTFCQKSPVCNLPDKKIPEDDLYHQHLLAPRLPTSPYGVLFGPPKNINYV